MLCCCFKFQITTYRKVTKDSYIVLINLNIFMNIYHTFDVGAHFSCFFFCCWVAELVSLPCAPALCLFNKLHF